MNLILKEPTIEYLNEVIDMCNEIRNSNDEFKFEGLGSLEKVIDEKSYKDWLAKCELDKHIEDIKPEWSNSINYLLVDENNHVYGSCSLRIHLKGELINIGGNIGYGIRPSERKKGYGVKQLNLILKEAKINGLNEVLITCRENNIGSSKVIEKCGGISDKKVPSKYENVMESRYWIYL